VHDRHSMTPRVHDAVAAWRARIAGATVTLVRGNHDRHVARMPDAWGLEEVGGDETCGPFVLAHEPEPDPRGYVLGGHLHPTVELRSGRQRLRLPCFHFGAHVGVLPAFNTFTNGVRVRRVRGSRTFAVAEGSVIEI